MLAVPTPRALVGPRRCPKCGKVRRLAWARTPRRRLPRWRTPHGWRRNPAGLYVPEIVAASGDVMLDDSGNVILDDDGNVLLDDGAGCNSCCGGNCGPGFESCSTVTDPAATSCADCGDASCVPRQLAATLSVTVCTCAETFPNAWDSVVDDPSGTYTLDFSGSSGTCAWSWQGGSFTVDRYFQPGCDPGDFDQSFTAELLISVVKTTNTQYDLSAVLTDGSNSWDVFSAINETGQLCCKLISITANNACSTCGASPSNCYATGGTLFVEAM